MTDKKRRGLDLALCLGAGLFYLLMNGVVTLFFSRMNRRLAYYKE